MREDSVTNLSPHEHGEYTKCQQQAGRLMGRPTATPNNCIDNNPHQHRNRNGVGREEWDMECGEERSPITTTTATLPTTNHDPTADDDGGGGEEEVQQRMRRGECENGRWR